MYGLISQSSLIRKTIHFYHWSRSECLYSGICPKQIHFPAVKNDYFLTYAAEDIITVLAKAPAPKLPIFEVDDETKNALLNLALLFDQTDGNNKKIPIQNKQKINITQQKLVPLPTAPVPRV